MKILFANFGRENLGIEYLSAVLKGDGHEVSLAHDPGIFSKEDNVLYSPRLEKIFKRKDISEDIIRINPDVVAFSVYTTTYQWACKVARELKERTSIPVVFGGIHPTLVPEKVISQPFVDYVTIGEGELSFLTLIRAIQDHKGLNNVNNLYYKAGRKVISNGLLDKPIDLNTLPFPDKELFSRHIRYRDDYMILTSRGCPFNCSYCCESYLNRIYKGNYFRRRSVESVMQELLIMKKKYMFKEVMFFDSIFFTDKKWLKGLLTRYKTEIGVPFRCLGHVNFIDYEVGKLLKDSGCYCINFGIQTFNQKIRKEILNRSENDSQISAAFKICDDLQLRYDVDLMFGLPGAKEADYILPLKFMNNIKYLNRLKCYNLSYFPRLEIINNARHAGMLNQSDIERIEEGDTGDFFHLDSIKDAPERKLKNNFQKLYKIYPIFPSFIRTTIINHRLYRYCRFIPNSLVTFLQLTLGVFRKDYRFGIYLSNYIFQIKNFFLRAENKK